MLTPQEFKKEILSELESEKSSPEFNLTDFLLDKIAILSSTLEKQELRIKTYEQQLSNSELFFSMPEVELMTRSKLPHVLIEAGDVSYGR